MTAKLKSLREKRGKIADEMRKILDAAAAAKREPAPEELARHETLFSEQEGLRLAIQAEERQAELERQLGDREAAGRPPPASTVEERRMQGFRSWLTRGVVAGEGAEEFRALQADSDTAGGFIVPPEQFVAQLLKNIDDQVFIRQRATRFTVAAADSLGVPTLDADPADADWTTELATGGEDSTMAFGKRSLHPHPLAKRIKVSKKLLRVASMAPETLVQQRLAYKFAVTEEKAFLTGTGAGQPLGVYTASADGIPTTRDVSSGNTTTSVTFDGLIAAKFALKGQYWGRARWNFHRDAVQQIAKLKDGEGQYLWRQSVREGEPDTVLGLPLDMSEYTPNTFTTGLYVGCVGDFSNYWIVDALTMTLQRLVELYAETNQDGFIGRLEVDGAPVLAEAFARVKLA